MRAEIVAAFVNSTVMAVLVTLICVAAINRLLEPREVHGETVTLVASIGLAVNLLVAWLLARGERTLNVRAALLHVMGDLLGSIAALIAGVVITFTGWTPIDPMLSLAIGGLIMISSLRLLREALHALMEGVPLHLSLPEVGQARAMNSEFSPGWR